jgi:hypothetical protein
LAAAYDSGWGCKALPAFLNVGFQTNASKNANNQIHCLLEEIGVVGGHIHIIYKKWQRTLS